MQYILILLLIGLSMSGLWPSRAMAEWLDSEQRWAALPAALSLSYQQRADGVRASGTTAQTITSVLDQSGRSQPPSQCEPTGCAYAERHVNPGTDLTMLLRIQGSASCGQRCGRWFWVSNFATNEVIISVDDLPGDNYLLFGWGESRSDFSVHTLVFVPNRSPTGDPSLSQYLHRVFVWDPAIRTFNVQRITLVSRSDLPALLRTLEDQQYFTVFSSWVN
jgi:hypothetical protein